MESTKSRSRTSKSNLVIDKKIETVDHALLCADGGSGKAIKILAEEVRRLRNEMKKSNEIGDRYYLEIHRLRDEISRLRDDLFQTQKSAMDAGYAQGVESTEARAIKRIDELEAEAILLRERYEKQA